MKDNSKGSKMGDCRGSVKIANVSKFKCSKVIIWIKKIIIKALRVFQLIYYCFDEQRNFSPP